MTHFAGEEFEIPSSCFGRNGHMPTGLNTAADGSGKKYKADVKYKVTSNLTLYAQWSDSCLVTFNANGGRGIMESQSLVPNEWQKLKKNTFIRDGYSFKCWNTMSDGSGKDFVDGDQRFRSGGDIVLHAQWVENNCFITFEANGGVGEMQGQAFAPGIPITLNANKFALIYGDRVTL